MNGIARHLLAVALLATLTVGAARPPQWKDLTPEQTAAIDEAAAKVTPQVKPSKKAKVLIGSYAQGFWHGSIPYAYRALEQMGINTGAYELVTAEDASAFTKENLARFDAVFINNLTGIDRFIPDAAGREALIDFVRNGGGLFANHSASDGGWPEYNELLGGRFSGHPWGSGGLWAFQVEEPDHALCKAFHEPRFQLRDEIYMLKDQFSRDTHRVLVSLDLADTATDDALKGGGRSDHDFAVSMVRRFGKGRVFYSVFGHREDIHSNPTLLQHYFDGIQYVLGDLKVDDTPVDEWTRLRRFRFGRSLEVEQRIRQQIREADAEGRKKIETHMLAALTADTTYDGKAFVLDTLPQTWSDKSIPALIGMLADPDHNQRAISALRVAMLTQRADREKVLAAVRQALAQAPTAAKVPLLNALALEKDKASLSAFATYAAADDPRLADAGIVALGRFGADGVKALQNLHSDGTRQQKIDDALFAAAESLLHSGKKADAATVYQERLDEKYPQSVRIAALRGLCRSDAGQGATAVNRFIAAGPSPLRQAALLATDALDAASAEKSLATAATADNFTEAEQIALVTALRNCGGEAMCQRLRALAAASSPAVAAEAVEALTAIGSAADVPALVAVLQRDDAASDRALSSLPVMRADGIDAALVQACPTAPEPVQARLATILGDRRTPLAAKLLMSLRNSPDRNISKEAWRSLKYCATAAELPELLASLATIEAKEGALMRRVLMAVGQRGNNIDQTVAVLLDGYEKANIEGRQALLETLGYFQNDRALQALRTGLRDPQQEIRYESLKALSKWESAAPLPDLLAFARGTTDSSTHILALRGLADVLLRQNDKLPAERLAAEYQSGFAEAKQPEELAALLTAVAGFHSRAALALAAPYLNHPDDRVYAAAWQAIASLHSILGGGGWKFASSHGENSLTALTDGRQDTRWSSGTSMQPGMWLSIDLGDITPVRLLTLDNTNDGRASYNDYGRKLKVFHSDDGKAWQPLPAQISEGVKTTINCDVKTRWLKVENGEANGSFWSIHELWLHDGPEKSVTPVQVQPGQLTVTASAKTDQAGQAIDNNDGSAWETDQNMAGKEWFEIAFDKPRTISSVRIDSRRQNDKQARGIAFSVSDGKRWTPPLMSADGGSLIELSLYPAPIHKLRLLQTRRDGHHWAIGEVQLFELPTR